MIDKANYRSSEGRGLEAIGEPEARRLADYWASKRAGRRMPRRGDIDPTEIPWALPRFFLVDYDRSAETYRYRIAGEEIERVFARRTGRSTMRGLTLEDMLPAEAAALVAKRWRPLVERGDIVYTTGLVYLPAERYPVGARILLPLSESGDGTVTGLAGFTVCAWKRAAAFSVAPGVDVTYIPLDEIRSGHPPTSP